MSLAEARFSWPVRVYWEDTDAGGVVFYANYLKFFERARTEWLRALGIEQRCLRLSTGAMFVVTETALRYLGPARLDDQLSVTATLIETGRASLTIRQTALLKNERGTMLQAAPTLLCEGTIRLGWVDAQSFRPARLPQALLEALQQARAAPAFPRHGESAPADREPNLLNPMA